MAAQGTPQVGSTALQARFTAPGMQSDPHPSNESELLHTRQLSQLYLILLRLRRHRLAMVGIGILLFMLILAAFAPWLASENIYDTTSNDIFNAQDKAPTLSGGLRYIFGADFIGRSVSSQIIWGTRYTLLISFTSAIVSTMIGLFVGCISGYYGRWG